MKPEEYMWDYRNPYLWMQRVMTSKLPPMMITCAITGGVEGKEANPNLPETAEEQADAVYEVYKAGAVSVHIHARDPENQSMTTKNKDDYSRVNKLIRERCPDIIINNTTGGGPWLSTEERMCCLFSDPKPDMASLNLGPFVLKVPLKDRKEPIPNPRPGFVFDACIPASYTDINLYAKTMKEKGIRPEIELYHPGQYWVIQDLLREKNIEPPHMIQFVMGFQTSSYPTPANVLSLVNELPPDSMFSLIGVGPFQIPMNTLSVMLGGHVRVGMEDNLYYKKGEKLKSNAQLVERIKKIAELMNREVATVAQAREMLGLSKKPA
ncbi:MAG TPA: 3-keto-5-aminohexanoate cleavage protein [Spirochaetes bacterium]|nr:3-keto-5-aminohexanoate cleavage protein [Spirochaetota bacterium]